jgi:hypothetical protein
MPFHELAEIVHEAIDAVSVHSNGSFSWFGSRMGAVTPQVRRSLTREQLDGYLHHRLQHHLYRRFYATGFPVPIRSIDETDQPPAPAVVEKLSKANTGRGAEETGWKIVDERGSTTLVTRNGMTLEVATNRIIGRSRATVSIRFLKELREESPGFYTALGDRSFGAREPLIRFYWNLRPDAAATFIGETTRRLNEKRIAFRAKVLHDPARFDRCDAAVIYTTKRDRESVYRVLTNLYRRLEKHLKPLTPVFTKRIGRGVAIAEDPPDRVSFGQHRCGILAEAILGAHRRGLTTPEAQFQEVLAAFARHRISFRDPFLNPGSADAYPDLAS